MLERSPVWNGDPVDFDKITVIPITDDKSAELAYLAGELDYTTIAVSSIPAYRDGELPPDTRLEVRPTTGFSWLGMNIEHEPYGDIRIRRALHYAIDQEAIIEAAYFGAGPRSVSLIAPGVLGWRDLPPTPYDPEKARALLAEAGMADGFRTTMSIMNAPDQRASAEIIQAQSRRRRRRGGDPELRRRHLLEPWTGGDGRRLEGPATHPAAVDLEQRPEHHRDLVHARADRVLELAALEQPRNSGSSPSRESPRPTPPDATRFYARMSELMNESAAFVPITHEPQAALYNANIEPNFLPDLSVLYRHIKWVG